MLGWAARSERADGPEIALSPLSIRYLVALSAAALIRSSLIQRRTAPSDTT